MVFRADSAAARAWVFATTALYGVAFGVELATTRFADPLRPGLGGSFVSLLCTLNLLWGAAESLHYWILMRRRLRLGLADPLVVDRFRLWSIGLGAMSLLMASTILAPAVGVDPAAPGWVLLESLAGLVGAVALWLAFFPSRAYRASVARRAQPAGLR
jgi:hypothetical protein